jgi:hypothetical protein
VAFGHDQGSQPENPEGPPLPEDEALPMASRSGIHTFGMGYPIDVVFLYRQARIVCVRAHAMAGWVRIRWGAAAVLEARAGQAARHALVVGTELSALCPALGSRRREFKRRIVRPAESS